MRLTTRIAIAVATLLAGSAAWADLEPGFVPLFNGTDTTGWHGGNYVVENGLLVCPKDGGGLFLTDREYSDFAFSFEFKLPPGGNNGVAIRTPAEGNPADAGMEIQILDDTAPQYATLQPYQFHGSIYHLVPAKRGALNPVGEWNSETILAQGPHIRVTVNGKVTVDAQLDKLDPELLKQYPGCLRPKGYVGFIGHGDRIEFRNMAIMELGPDDTPPAGFEALFNGRDLTGWKGLVADPPARAKMTPEQLAAAQATADQRMRDHWKVEDGALVFDGGGDSLCTAKDYGDFELLVDWKILKAGDSGIYLRGSPQVQIWENPVGSGGLYNNQKNPSQPLKVADLPVESWNHFAIRMMGEKVSVWLNDVLVVDNTTMENYWERDKPIYPTGQIELQNHGNTLWFKNVYLKELPR
jgi:3-keto-disaccharide hydrolase